VEGLTNCKNCGAPLTFNKNDYGRTAKCKYCDTEYHLDLLGRVEEYKIKIDVMGKIREYYIGEMSFEPLFDTAYRTIDGKLYYSKPIYKTKLNLIEI